MKAEQIISIIGLVDDERQIQVQSVMRVLALPVVPEARSTSFVAQLMGKEGNVVASAPVMRLDSHGCGCGEDGEQQPADEGPFVFQAILPDVEPGTALRIVQKGEQTTQKELWMRRAPEREPQVRGFSVSVASGQGHAKWEAQGMGGQPLEFALQFSKDGGRSWNSLAAGIRENSHEFALADLPGGAVIFRLLVHDGFFTAAADSKRVLLPGRGPVVSILHPQEGPALVAGQPMRLWAAVSTSTGELPGPEASQWFIDGKEVARGLDAWETAPESGEHTCSLVVEDEQGRGEAEVTFRTIDPGEEERPVQKPLLGTLKKGKTAGRKDRRPPRK